jgi:transmembrane sensor
MENNNQYDEFLVRYLFNEGTEEERAFVENWLSASEENQGYFNRLKRASQLAGLKQDLKYIMDEANLKAQRNQLIRKMTKKETRIIPLNEQDTSENVYGEEEQPARKAVLYRLLVSVAIAASVLLVVGLGWKLFVANKTETSVVQHTGEKRDSVVFVVRHEVNTTGKEKRIELPDGSVILLADKSELTYEEPFTKRRDITLIGKAYFKVAKDQTRPFKVITGDISTTALGTEFTVTAIKEQKRIIVRLYEGKVVVKPVNKANKQFKNDVYLLPGQEFVYNNQARVKKQTFKLNNAAAPEEIMSEEQQRDNPALPENAASPYFMFNNQPLGDVLDDLAGLYHVKIVYDKKDVQNLYIIGKYNSSDSLETILKRIATLNNLIVTKKDNSYIISK